jgi:hypothetical protein
MTRNDAREYVSLIVDNAGSARTARPENVLPTDWLVGWQCGFEPAFVAVRSYLSDTAGNPDVIDDAEEAIELATDYLAEVNWFNGAAREPDHLLAPEKEASK